MADWNKIKTEYITTDTSYRKLAVKYGLSRNTVAQRAKDEKWPSLRGQHRDKTLTKTLKLVEKNQAKKMARINAVADKLLEKLERAVEELDIQLVKHTTKIKEIEYNNDVRPDKPTKEIVREEEQLVDVVTVIDRAGLKQIASALKDIKEAQMIRSELDQREQEARIANLQRQAQKDAEDSQAVQVLMGEEIEELAQ